ARTSGCSWYTPELWRVRSTVQRVKFCLRRRARFPVAALRADFGPLLVHARTLASPLDGAACQILFTSSRALSCSRSPAYFGPLLVHARPLVSSATSYAFDHR